MPITPAAGAGSPELRDHAITEARCAPGCSLRSLQNANREPSQVLVVRYLPASQSRKRITARAASSSATRVRDCNAVPK